MPPRCATPPPSSTGSKTVAGSASPEHLLSALPTSAQGGEGRSHRHSLESAFHQLEPLHGRRSACGVCLTLTFLAVTDQWPRTPADRSLVIIPRGSLALHNRSCGRVRQQKREEGDDDVPPGLAR